MVMMRLEVKMYSYEMEQYIRNRNYILNQDECGNIVNINENPQIKSMKYFCEGNRYVIITDDGYTFEFSVKA